MIIIKKTFHPSKQYKTKNRNLSTEFIFFSFSRFIVSSFLKILLLKKFIVHTSSSAREKDGPVSFF